MSDQRRLLDKLLRELSRAEAQAISHPAREARRIGEAAPVQALRDVALHAHAMRPRLVHVLDAHDLVPPRGVTATPLTTLRYLVADRIHDAERTFRAALLDLRHGLDVVRVLREVARHEGLFALIRWCDDWLSARRALVACVEAQLDWFAEASLDLYDPATDDTLLDIDPSETPRHHR